MSKKRREEACRCGSEKKYKKCCMIKPLSRNSLGASVRWEDSFAVEGVSSLRPSRCKLWDRQNWSE